MLAIRRSQERGHASHGWLDSYHTFSFAGYHDPDFMGFRDLRVINEDVVEPGEGFPTHPHRDMEILTYVISGALSHKDSMGNGSTIKPGFVQGMSAGSGVTHSEFNASKGEPVHLLQIWIMPNVKNVTPAYGEWPPSGEEKKGFALVAGPGGDKNSILIHQDAKLYLSVADKEKTLDLPLKPGRFGWLQVAAGSLSIAGQKLAQGDGAAFSADAAKNITASAGSEILLFDLA